MKSEVRSPKCEGGLEGQSPRPCAYPGPVNCYVTNCRRKSPAGKMKKGATLAGALGLLTWGCVNLHPTLLVGAPPYSEIYQRATNEFACAEYYKPAETKTNSGDLSFTLAPLILQQVEGAQELHPPSDGFGALSVSNGAPVLDRERPTVYWEADTLQINGKAHARFAYVWCYDRGPQEPKGGTGTNYMSPSRADAGLPLQGIRITLNSGGQPVIWEVLADHSKAKILFVSQSLESAAMAEFGKPLPGRRYAIERSTEEAPDVVIARVIDDSPMPMGPIVYQSAGTREVSALICRCMPAQARKLLGSATYNLLPFQGALTQPLLLEGRRLMNGWEGFWPGDDKQGRGIEACLRLPGVFSSPQGPPAR